MWATATSKWGTYFVAGVSYVQLACVCTRQVRLLLAAQLFSVLPVTCAQADMRGTSSPDTAGQRGQQF